MTYTSVLFLAISVIMAMIAFSVAVSNARLKKEIKELMKQLQIEKICRSKINDTTNKRDLFRKYSSSDFIGYSVELFKDMNGVMKMKSVPFEIFLTKKRYIERKRLYKDKDEFYSNMRLIYVIVKDIEDEKSPKTEWSYKQLYDNRRGEMLTEMWNSEGSCLMQI